MLFYIIKFAYFYLFFISIPLLILLIIYRLYYYKPVFYRYTLGSYLKSKKLNNSFSPNKILFFLRLFTLFLLLLLISKPQIVDYNSKINVEGIDIVLVIDVSGSMNCFDEEKDRRPRIEIAKDEAIRFIKKRENDAIGLIVFAKNALTKCPLTLDKKIIKEIIENLNIGEIDANETSLATSIVTASTRLKNSTAKSKIMILLTDGEPTPSDINPNLAIEIAKKLGIKIYTIGIGDEHGGLIEHPFFGVVPCGSKLNTALLKHISDSTGGKFFHSKNSKDMREIYNIIDQLEKTKHETNIFNKYYDFFMPLLIIVFFLLFIELFLTTFVWFSL